MKQVFRIAAASGLLLIAGVASAQVLNSPHDLTGGTATTTETCVFCHTPHGSDTGAPVPLWNKTLPNGGGYTTYAELNTSTLDGLEATNVGSVSLACLSCHDGVQAVDSVINAPGRGLNGGSVGPGETINNPAATNPLALIGTDLRNDHPISIQYGGGGILATNHTDGTQFPANSTRDPDFVGPFKATINSNPAWWVNNPIGAGNGREKTDMILYTRSDANIDAGVAQPFVECGSCHDPHNSSTFVANQSVAFLRIANDDSQICTTCHIK